MKETNLVGYRDSLTFNTFINFHELREIIMSGGSFTWSNNQEDPLLEKLDRILVTKDWEDIFPHAMVRKLPRDVSDHNPLILSIGQCTSSKLIQFNFELSWLENLEFLWLLRGYGINLVEINQL